MKFKNLIRFTPSRALILYNAACVYCTAEKKGGSPGSPAQSLGSRFSKMPVWARRDPDIAILHGEPQLERLYPEKGPCIPVLRLPLANQISVYKRAQHLRWKRPSPAQRRHKLVRAAAALAEREPRQGTKQCSRQREIGHGPSSMSKHPNSARCQENSLPVQHFGESATEAMAMQHRETDLRRIPNSASFGLSVFST